MRRQSRLLAVILAAGILSRVVIGLTLFWISYLQLPFAESLQAGGGFWQIAVDASRYYVDAVAALQDGILTADYEASPSPLFVKILTIWLLLVGTSPVAGLLLNVCAYVATCALIVKAYGPVNDWRQDLPCLVAIGAYSFWPTIFIHGTQPLKDDFFFALIAVVCLALLTLLRVLVYGRHAARSKAMVAGAFAAVTAASFGLAGIRWYFPIIVCGALVCVSALFLLRGRLTSLPIYLGGSALLVAAVWLAAGGFKNFATVFVFAAANDSPLAAVRSVGDIPAALIELSRIARASFLTSGGDTNIVAPVRKAGSLRAVRPRTFATVVPGRRSAREEDDAPLTDVELAASRAIPQTFSEHVVAATRGLAIVFVPISLLKSISFVQMAGGRGFLPVADVDTLFQDVAIVALLSLLWSRRRDIGTRIPFVAFCLILTGATAVLLGYVVTNYGTLVRMRPMMAIPLCVLVVALSPRADAAGQHARLRARLAI